jgi:hypothetical protein
LIEDTLYMFHYIKRGTGLSNMVSDGKDGGQYLRNPQKIAVQALDT